MSHSPGPWQAEHMHSAICANEMTLARVYWSEGRTDEENIANAKIMAESPEMLKVIQIVAEATGSTDLEYAQNLSKEILTRLRNN